MLGFFLILFYDNSGVFVSSRMPRLILMEIEKSVGAKFGGFLTTIIRWLSLSIAQ